MRAVPYLACIGLFLMAGVPPARADMTPADVQARDDAIIGRPQRVAPLKPGEMSQAAKDEAEAFRRSVAGVTPNAVKPGEVPTMLATMLRHPALWSRHIEMAKEFLNSGRLTPRDRELAVLRVAWLCRAPVEWGEHVAIARKIGITADEIERLTHGAAAPGWSEADAALIRAVEELHGDAMISDATWTELAKTRNEQQLIELPMLVGHYTTVAYYQNALRLAPRPGIGGLVSR